MKYLIKIAQLFYTRQYVGDEKKRYIRADKKEIIISSCGYVVKVHEQGENLTKISKSVYSNGSTIR